MRSIYAAAIAVGGIMAVSASRATPLDEYLWKNRVLVISAPAGDADAERQRAIYRAAAAGMSERDIVLVEATGSGERPRQIRSQVAAEGTRFQVFLVGKDGHTALSSDKPLSADYLFGKVDAMPMRRDEMRRGH